MVKLLLLGSWRYFRRHPAQLALSLMGIVLGVAIVTAVIITNESSKRAFEQTAASVTDKTTHQITGGTSGIAESDYVSLRTQTSIKAAPIIIGYLQLQEELFTVHGIDPFAELEFGRTRIDLPELDLSGLNSGLNQTSSATLLISEQTRSRLQLPLNQILNADVSGQQKKLTLTATYASDNPAATEGILIGDIATVQNLFGRQGFIDHIDLSLTDAEAQTLSPTLPAHLQLLPAGNRLERMNQLTRGFQINLTAMSLLALLIGAFLIHNSMTFSVLQRREEFSIKRIVGATSQSIAAVIAAEVIAISVIASIIGVAVGIALAHYLIQLTTRTINDLYFVLHVQEIWFSVPQLFLLVLLGVVTSFIAAMASAYEAASISPLHANSRSRLETRTRQWLPLVAFCGLALLLIGIGLAVFPSRSLVLGFAAMMLFILGYGLTVPWLVSTCVRIPAVYSRSAHPVLTMIIGSVRQNISRTGLAIAALTIALAATLGVDIMIGSFRNTVDHWLGSTLQSDIYVTVPGTVGARGNGTLGQDFLRQLQDLPDIDNIGTARSVRIDSEGGSLEVLALTPHNRSRAGFDFIEGDIDTIWSSFVSQNGILITEPLANRLDLKPDQTLKLFTDRNGYREFRILGVYRDYGSSLGRLAMTQTTYRKFWDDPGSSSVGINLKRDRQSEETLTTLRRLASEGNQALIIRANQDIRERSLEVFDQTFQVTRVLRLLTVGVAFIGVFSALLALQLEKAREYAIVRAVGATPALTATIVLGQTALMGIIAGLLALPLGWIMAEILIHVINLRSFGWSMERQLPTTAIPETLIIAIGAALLAGIYPMWTLTRKTIVQQLRDE